MVISDTSYMIDGLPLLYWHRNLGKSGQSRDCKNRIRLQERSYDCTKDQLMMDNAGITKIAYDLRRDLTTAQLCSCRQRIN